MRRFWKYWSLVGMVEVILRKLQIDASASRHFCASFAFRADRCFLWKYFESLASGIRLDRPTCKLTIGTVPIYRVIEKERPL